MIRVKICCISSVAEAQLAIRLGASAVGLVSEMPSGPGVLPERLIAEIAAAVSPPIATFLLTSKTSAQDIVPQQRRCGTNTIQLCDRVEPGVYQELRRAMPGVSLVQVVHITGEESLAEALAAAAAVDALLLDSGNQARSTKELGGTGRTHDWSLSSRIVSASPVPVFLAGGLNPENVAAAIAEVRPFAVDVCSGVRMQKKLSEPLLAQFISKARLAGEQVT